MLEFIRDVWQHLTKPDQLELWVTGMGVWLYVILFAVVFCETGLVVTPILPGDSMLFAVGVVTMTSGLNLPATLAVLIGAAVLGDAVNYFIGYHVGPAAFRSQRSWLLNPKHVVRAQQFYDKYGGKAIILARFVPIVRTFAPFVAGIGKMRYRKFFAYNVVGGAAWVLICVFAGRFFADFVFVKEHFELVIVAIVLISVMPMVVEFLLAWRRRGRVEQPDAGEAAVNDAPLNGAATKQETAIKAPAGGPQ
jgi:membrane-associated protein